MLNHKAILIFGGTGFLGRYIVKHLAQTGATINIITRNPNDALYLKTSGSVGQINLIKGSINDHDLITQWAAKSNIIINAVGILHEKHSQDFINTHAKFPEFLGELAAENNIEKLIHISALGVDKNTQSKYAVTKLQGELALHHKFPKATILRPSVVFGFEDQFFNRFAKLLKLLPIIGVVFSGKTKLQPVYVNDVAKAIYRIATSETACHGQIYELGGPDIFSLKEIIDFIAKNIAKKYYLLKLPVFIAHILAIIFELFPNPILTRDQIRLLKTDNVTQDKVKTFFHLQLQPHKIEEIVPNYLKQYKSDCYHKNND